MPIKKKKHWVVMRNDLVQTYWPFNLEEQKTLYILFLAIKAGNYCNNSLLSFDEKECVVSISKNEFFEILGLGDKSYDKDKTWKNIIAGLYAKSWVSLDTKDSHQTSAIITHSNWEFKKNFFEVGLNPMAMVYLDNLISNYAPQDLIQIMGMKSKFSIILFRKLCYLKNKTSTTIFFTSQEISDFGNKAIELAVKEINDLTKMSVTFTKTTESEVSYEFVYEDKCPDEIPDGLSFLQNEK